MKLFYLSLFLIVFPQFISAQTFFINERGCVVCQDAKPGDTGVIDGVTYTAVDSAMLVSDIRSGKDLTKLCVSLVTDMSNLFSGMRTFNQSISNWDVSNVTNMRNMFNGAKAFNQPIGNWDVSQVIDMSQMFYATLSFNQNIGDWDVSKVNTMYGMFTGAKLFNQPLENWNVSKVSNMRRMFYSANSFNQSIDYWDVSKVNDMTEMFRGASSFNQNIGDWDVSMVNTMFGMFYDATAFNQQIGNWDVSNLNSLGAMFYNATSFNQSIENWDVSKVTYMNSMFASATSFNQDLSHWCVSNITSEPEDFSINSSLQSDYKPKWGKCSANPIAIESIQYPNPLNEDFSWEPNELASHYQLRLQRQDEEVPILDTTLTESVLKLQTPLEINQIYTFSIRGIRQEPLLRGRWGEISFEYISNVSAEAFLINDRGCITCENASPGEASFINGELYIAVDKEMLQARIESDYDLTKVCVSLITDMSELFIDEDSFKRSIGNWDGNQVTDDSGMLSNMRSFNQAIGNWDVSNVINMSGMFSSAESFNQHIENWDVSNVTDMSLMFSNASSFNQPIGNWNVSNVTDMSGMFYGVGSFNQPIGNWDVSNVINMSGMFSSTESFNQHIENWDVSSVTDMSYMFEGAASFNEPIGNWDVSQVTSMYDMFSRASSFNQTIGNWDVSNVSYMNRMFYEASSFNQDLSKWCVSTIKSEASDFSYDSSLQADYLPKWGTCPENPITIESIQFSNSTNSTITWKANDLASHYQVRLQRKDETNPFLDSTITESVLRLQTPLEQKEFYQFSIRGIQEEPFLRGRWIGPIEFQGDSTTVSNEEDFILPTEFQLTQNFPNPFNPSTQIRYSLPQSSLVRIEVFSSIGQRIAVLVNEQKQAGEHTLQFNAQNLASGVYLYRIITPEFSQTRLMNLVK